VEHFGALDTRDSFKSKVKVIRCIRVKTADLALRTDQSTTNSSCGHVKRDSLELNRESPEKFQFKVEKIGAQFEISEINFNQMTGG